MEVKRERRTRDHLIVRFSEGLKPSPSSDGFSLWAQAAPCLKRLRAPLMPGVRLRRHDRRDVEHLERKKETELNVN